VTQTRIGPMLPYVRPLNRSRDGQMLVIVSRRPLLSMARYEFEVYNTIDGHKSVDEF